MNGVIPQWIQQKALKPQMTFLEQVKSQKILITIHFCTGAGLTKSDGRQDRIIMIKDTDPDSPSYGEDETVII